MRYTKDNSPTNPLFPEPKNETQYMLKPQTSTFYKVLFHYFRCKLERVNSFKENRKLENDLTVEIHDHFKLNYTFSSMMCTHESNLEKVYVNYLETPNKIYVFMLVVRSSSSEAGQAERST